VNKFLLQKVNMPQVLQCFKHICNNGEKENSWGGNGVYVALSFLGLQQ
jgi:hypothetical protein